MLSDLGSRISGIALPLLVLVETHSPARAGIVGFAETLPLLVLTLPAGALVDRLNRKRVMVLTDAARCAAFAGLVAAVALGHVAYALIVAVALVDGVGFVLFAISERAALPHVVTDEQLPTALAQNQGREYAALLVGPPLGGVLFGVGRSVPFLANAVSYLVSVVSLLLVRKQLQEAREPRPRHLRREVVEGVRWLWHQPFVRTTSLLVMGSDFTLNSLYLTVIVLARHRGASPSLIGAMFAFIGVGGILGALAAPTLSTRLPTRVVVVATMTLEAALVPLLIVVPGALGAGIVYGAMFVLHPTWGSVIMAYRMRLTPDPLRGRVTSVATLFSLGPVAFAMLAVGFLLQALGTTPTILALTGVMLVVAMTAWTHPAIRHPPELELQPA